MINLLGKPAGRIDTPYRPAQLNNGFAASAALGLPVAAGFWPTVKPAMSH
jgi:hypothetical protein